MNDKRNKRRAENYTRLRKAGFSAERATKLKDFSRKTVSGLCSEMSVISEEYRTKAEKTYVTNLLPKSHVSVKK